MVYLSGGGSYDTKQQVEVDVKIGKWIELSEDLKKYMKLIIFIIVIVK